MGKHKSSSTYTFSGIHRKRTLDFPFASKRRAIIYKDKHSISCMTRQIVELRRVYFTWLRTMRSLVKQETPTRLWVTCEFIN